MAVLVPPHNHMSVILIEQFLQQIERKAFKMAWMATKSEADALDLVQNAMMKLVECYADKEATDWKPLFYKILQNQIKNWYRRENISLKIFFWQKTEYDDEGDSPRDEFEDLSASTPEQKLEGEQLSLALLTELEQLPIKQQQCFLLRSWEGLSVKETANIMQCSEGTVKTHMSRASQKLWAHLKQEVESSVK